MSRQSGLARSRGPGSIRRISDSEATRSQLAGQGLPPPVVVSQLPSVGISREKRSRVVSGSVQGFTKNVMEILRQISFVDKVRGRNGYPVRKVVVLNKAVQGSRCRDGGSLPPDFRVTASLMRRAPKVIQIRVADRKRLDLEVGGGSRQVAVENVGVESCGFLQAEESGVPGDAICGLRTALGEGLF